MGTLETLNNNLPSGRQRRRRPKAKGKAADGSPARNDQYQMKAIARALDVLDAFDDTDTPLALKDIAGLVHLPESSLFRILLTLKAQGYLLQNEDGSYRLPDKLLYGRLHERGERLKKALRPLLEGLAAQFDETASLAYLYGDRIRVLDAVETFQEIRMTNRPGRALPPHCSSMGKAITAFQEPARIERMFDAYGLFRRTEYSIIDRHVLVQEFAAIRERGYAADRQETVLGGICLGAPITAADKRVIAAMSVSTPMIRMTREREAEITRTVMEFARRASREVREAGLA